jgi:hypothetical protein
MKKKATKKPAKKTKSAKKKSGTVGPIVVNIYETPWGPYVDQEPVYMGVNDEIEWHYAPTTPFTVDFSNQSPFSGNSFGHGHSHSGKPVVHPNPHKVYKYWVQTNAGRIDPGVIVH